MPPKKNDNKVKFPVRVAKENDEEINEEIKGISSKAAKSLQKISEFDVNFSSNLELIRNLRHLLVQALQVCEGAYRAKPTSGNSYALANMVTQVREMTDRLEESIDYNIVASEVTSDVIIPFIEKLVLDLGTIISNELDNYDSKERKRISKVINIIYKKFGSKIETKIPMLQKKIIGRILESVK